MFFSCCTRFFFLLGGQKLIFLPRRTITFTLWPASEINVAPVFVTIFFPLGGQKMNFSTSRTKSALFCPLRSGIKFHSRKIKFFLPSWIIYYCLPCRGRKSTLFDPLVGKILFLRLRKLVILFIVPYKKKHYSLLPEPESVKFTGKL